MTPIKIKLITGILTAHSMMGQIFASDNESHTEREALSEQASLQVALSTTPTETTTQPVIRQTGEALKLNYSEDEIREIVAKARKAEDNTLGILKNIIGALQERNEQQKQLVENLTALLTRSTPTPENPLPEE